MRLAFFLLFSLQLLCGHPASAAMEIGQRVRDVDISAEQNEIYSLAVVAAPKLTTTLRFPDSFRAENVLCGGACVDAAALQGSAPMAGANWLIDKRAEARTLHIWPARLPSASNPPSAYTTNLYVACDNGKAYHITLRLLDLASGAQQADAVVNIVNPKQPKQERRLAVAEQQCRAQARQELQREGRSLLLAGLDGPIRCDSQSWRGPFRQGLLLARLRQLCRSDSAQPLLWVHFELENRGDAAIGIDSVSLEANGATFGGASEASYFLPSSTLAGKSRISGVALRSFVSADVSAQGWQLLIVPEAGASDDSLRIDRLRF